MVNFETSPLTHKTHVIISERETPVIAKQDFVLSVRRSASYEEEHGGGARRPATPQKELYERRGGFESLLVSVR